MFSILVYKVKTPIFATLLKEGGQTPSFDPVAQPVEHLTFNQGVMGSNPIGITKAASCK